MSQNRAILGIVSPKERNSLELPHSLDGRFGREARRPVPDQGNVGLP
jgi:hypothetical protein